MVVNNRTYIYNNRGTYLCEFGQESIEMFSLYDEVGDRGKLERKAISDNVFYNFLSMTVTQPYPYVMVAVLLGSPLL